MKSQSSLFLQYLLVAILFSAAPVFVSVFRERPWHLVSNFGARVQPTKNTHVSLHHDMYSEIDAQDDSVVLNVLDFGAIGDTHCDDTAAVRRALRHASLLTNNTAGSKVTVLFPQDYVFSTGPLNLTSGITLQVDGTLRALTWREIDWPRIPPLVNYGSSDDQGFYLQYQSYLYAANAHDISITGTGVIDGRGQIWWDAFKNGGDLQAGRPNLIQFLRCNDMEVAGVTLKDAPFWCLHPVLCVDVHIHHTTIRSHMYAENSDGIDPDSSRNVLIEDNDVSCGDDHIAIKAGLCGKGKPLECDEHPEFTNGVYETVNITIRRNIFRTGMGIALGSECSGGIRDILIEDNLVGVCHPGHCAIGCCGWSPGLHLKTTDTRGGHMENIMFRNNTVYNTSSVIFLETDYQTNNDNEGRPTMIKNLTFENNKGRGSATGISLSCSKDLPCQDVSFLNNDFHPTSISCQNIEVMDENGKNICSEYDGLVVEEATN